MDKAALAAESSDLEQARGHLTAMLRCASYMGCTDAVACSDDTMIQLRRFLDGCRR